MNPHGVRERMRRAACGLGLPWHEPVIGGGDAARTTLEWRSGQRDLTVYVDEASVSYVASVNAQIGDMADGDIDPDDRAQLVRLWCWLLGESLATLTREGLAELPDAEVIALHARAAADAAALYREVRDRDERRRASGGGRALGAGAGRGRTQGRAAMSDGIHHRGETLPLCENTFVRLAAEDPALLMQAMRDGMRPTLLTFAAEHLGKGCRLPEALALLCELLGHDKVYVREGALYGLAGHLGDERVRQAVQRVAEGDDVEELRELARAMLDDWCLDEQVRAVRAERERRNDQDYVEFMDWLDRYDPPGGAR